MIIMNKNQNAEIKKNLLKKTFFSNIDHVPYIGDNYGGPESSNRILFLGNITPDAQASSSYQIKKTYPSENFCSRIVNTNDDLKKLLGEMKQSPDMVAFYNIFFDRVDGIVIPNQGVVKSKLAKYLEAFVFVVATLKPNKIVFFGSDVKTKIERVRTPEAFGNKSLDDYLNENKIISEIHHLHKGKTLEKRKKLSFYFKYLDLNDLMDSFDLALEQMSNVFISSFNGEYKDLVKENQRWFSNSEKDWISPDSFTKGVSLNKDSAWKLFLSMKYLYVIKNNLCEMIEKSDAKQKCLKKSEEKSEKDVNNYIQMLDILESWNVYIPYTLIPSFLSFIDEVLNHRKESIPLLEQESGFTVFLDDFNNSYEKRSGSGVLRQIYSITKKIRNGPQAIRKYDNLFSKRVFSFKVKTRLEQMIIEEKKFNELLRLDLIESYNKFVIKND